MGRATRGKLRGLTYSGESENEQSEEGCLVGAGGSQNSSTILKSILMFGVAQC